MAALTPAIEKAILEAIEDAIWAGAHDWDACAIPAVEEPAREALRRIKELLHDHR